jgi:hypothetical protein
MLAIVPQFVGCPVTKRYPTRLQNNGLNDSSHESFEGKRSIIDRLTSGRHPLPTSRSKNLSAFFRFDAHDPRKKQAAFSAARPLHKLDDF